MQEFHIKDDSGDRKYFTIIPNYVFNHSTIWDREVYCQMKRIAGESGQCWVSQSKLAKQCGISVNRIKKSLKYLLEHHWIEKTGIKTIDTKGGNQFVNVYTIVDLWQKNNDFYKAKGVSPNDTPTPKGVSRIEPKGYHENDKGVSPEGYKEEPLNKNHIKKNITSLADKSADSSNQLLKIFYEINPSLNFANKTYREASRWLIDRFGLEGAEKFARAACSIQGQKYAPTIVNPYQLKNKLAELKIYFDKQKTNQLIVEI